jgi:hypothetical protein
VNPPNFNEGVDDFLDKIGNRNQPVPYANKGGAASNKLSFNMNEDDLDNDKYKNSDDEDGGPRRGRAKGQVVNRNAQRKQQDSTVSFGDPNKEDDEMKKI